MSYSNPQKGHDEDHPRLLLLFVRILFLSLLSLILISEKGHDEDHPRLLLLFVRILFLSLLSLILISEKGHDEDHLELPALPPGRHPAVPRHAAAEPATKHIYIYIYRER